MFVSSRFAQYLFVCFVLGATITVYVIKQGREHSLYNLTGVEPSLELSPAPTEQIAQAQCPAQNPELTPWFPICNNGDCYGGPYYEDVLRYLNLGGNFQQLEERLGGHFIDITSDSVEEYVWRDTYAVFVLACQNGYFYPALSAPALTYHSPTIESIDDLNGNGIPEILLAVVGRPTYFRSLKIYEWNGHEFVSLIKIPTDNSTTDVLTTKGWEYNIQDTSQDQVQQIVAINELPSGESEIIVLGWDGQNYVIQTNHE